MPSEPLSRAFSLESSSLLQEQHETEGLGMLSLLSESQRKIGGSLSSSLRHFPLQDRLLDITDYFLDFHNRCSIDFSSSLHRYLSLYFLLLFFFRQDVSFRFSRQQFLQHDCRRWSFQTSSPPSSFSLIASRYTQSVFIFLLQPRVSAVARATLSVPSPAALRPRCRACRAHAASATRRPSTMLQPPPIRWIRWRKPGCRIAREAGWQVRQSFSEAVVPAEAGGCFRQLSAFTGCSQLSQSCRAASFLRL